MGDLQPRLVEFFADPGFWGVRIAARLQADLADHRIHKGLFHRRLHGCHRNLWGLHLGPWCVRAGFLKR